MSSCSNRNNRLRSWRGQYSFTSLGVDNQLFCSFRQRILCAILSHAVAWVDLPARETLLRSTAGVLDGTKLSLGLPLLQEILSGVDLPVEYYEAIFLLLDESAGPTLSSSESSEEWQTLLKVVDYSVHSGTRVHHLAVVRPSNPTIFRYEG